MLVSHIKIDKLEHTLKILMQSFHSKTFTITLQAKGSNMGVTQWHIGLNF